MSEPMVAPGPVQRLCGYVWPTREEALAQAEQLEAAGFVVVQYPPRRSRRSDGLVMVASVYHPSTGDSPGDLFNCEVPPSHGTDRPVDDGW